MASSDRASTATRAAARGFLLPAVVVGLGALGSAAIALGWADRALPGGAGGRGRALASIAAYSALSLLALFVWANRTGRRRQLVVAAVVTTIGLVAFDLGARAVGLPAGLPLVPNMGLSSRARHHAYPANARLRLGALDGRALTFRTNADGLRSPYGREAFAAAERRVALLGDSFVFGLGVQDGEDVASRLEGELRARAAPAAVLNAGIVSYSPFLERLLARDVVAAYRPDTVLLLLDATDIGDDLRYMNEASGEGDAVRFARGDDGASFRDLGPLWNVAQPLREALEYPFRALTRRRPQREDGYRYYRFDLELDGQRETNGYFIYRHPLETTRPYFERTLANVDAVAELVRSWGASFALVVLPRFHHWNAEECPNNWEAASYALDEPHQFEYFRFFREAAATRDYPIVDLLPYFEATDEFPLVLNADPHWNAAGHAFVARTLANLLLAPDGPLAENE